MTKANVGSVKSRIYQLEDELESAYWWEWIRKDRIRSDIGYWKDQLAYNGYSYEPRKPNPSTS